MKLKDFLEHVNNEVKLNPDLLELTIYTAKDAEGNGFNRLDYLPSIRYLQKEDCEVCPECLLTDEDFELADEEEYDFDSCKKVLLF